MGWRKKKAYSDKNISREEYWKIVTSLQGLTEKQHGPFIAFEFKDFVNGKDIRPGFVRKMVNVYGGANYLTLEEYQPDEFRFAVSVSTEHLDTKTKYLILRHQITTFQEGSRWNIEVSEKRGLFDQITGRFFLNNISGMFHGYETFRTA